MSRTLSAEQAAYLAARENLARRRTERVRLRRAADVQRRIDLAFAAGDAAKLEAAEEAEAEIDRRAGIDAAERAYSVAASALAAWALGVASSMASTDEERSLVAHLAESRSLTVRDRVVELALRLDAAGGAS